MDTSSESAMSVVNQRKYETAIGMLLSRRRPRRPDKPAVATNFPMSSLPNGKPQFTGSPDIDGMAGWLKRLGNPHEKLAVVHVAGTKGKGSTAAWVEVFLRAYGQRNGRLIKTGLYTSPHLMEVNERIRINFEPLAKSLFTKYFFEVYDRLELGSQPDTSAPRYLQFMALLSFYTFAAEQVDVAVYETHHGGEFDVTNIVAHPIVTAISSIGIDHVLQLGPSIENIAWHKAGIFKTGAAAFSAPQTSEVSAELKKRAAEKSIVLKFIQLDKSLPVKLPDVQRLNCSLGIQVSDAFLAAQRLAPLSKYDVLKGIEDFYWPGRFQTIIHSNRVFFLDGAHNDLSITEAASWFSKASQDKIQSTTFRDSSVTRIVVFVKGL